MKRRLKLVFVFTAMLVLMCRCQVGNFGFGRDPDLFSLADGSPLECMKYDEWNGELGTKSLFRDLYACSYTCPDGKKVEIDYDSNNPFPGQSVGSSDFQTQLNVQYCGVTPPATQPPIFSLLTGDVTECNLNSSFINFRLAQPPESITGKKLDVALNGQQADCSINPSNPTILTCPLPSTTLFPITVEVKLDRVQVNTFMYDGSTCVGNLSNRNQQGEGGSGPSAIQPPPPPPPPPPFHSP